MGIKIKPFPFCGQRMHVAYNRILKQYLFTHEQPKTCFINDPIIIDSYNDSFMTAIYKWNCRYNEK